jgi:hypothetical protein
LSTVLSVERLHAGWLERHTSRLIAVMVVMGASLVVGVGAGLGPLYGLGALGGVALALVVLWRPDVGALVLVATVPITAGLRRGLPLPGLRISEALIVGVSALILLLADRRQLVPWRTFDWLALAYVISTAGFGFFALLRRGDAFTADRLGTMLGPLQFLLLYRAVLTGLQTRQQHRRAIRLILYGGVVASLLATLQQLNVGPIRPLLATITGTDIQDSYVFEQLPRATGPFPHWQPLAAYLFVVVLLGVGLLLEGSGQIMSRNVLLIMTGISFAALIETVTIGPIIGAVAGSIWLAVGPRQVRKLIIWLVAGSVVMALLFGPLLITRYDQQFVAPASTAQKSLVPQTLVYRYEVWTKQYIPAVTASNAWIYGFGPDLPPQVFWKYTESLYLTLILRGGLPLLAVYGALVLAALVATRRAARQSQGEWRTVAEALFVALALLIPLQTIQAYFVQTGMSHLLWILLALVLRPERLILPSRPAEQEIPSGRPLLTTHQDKG